MTAENNEIVDPFADYKDSEHTEKKENNMNNTETNAKIVTTLKGGAGFDAPWIVVHSDTVQEAVALLDSPDIKTLIEKTKGVAAAFNTGGGSQGNRPKGQPAGATQAPNGQQPPEGYTFKSGTGKNGKPWKAFFPIDRNSGLEPIWL